MPGNRYPSDLSDAEWAILEPLVPGGRPRSYPTRYRLPLDAESSAPWVKEPVNLPPDHASVQAIQIAMQQVTGNETEVTISPFVCDANFWFPQGQPSLVFGVGDPSWGIHGANEHLPVADLIKATKVFAAVTMEWCGVA